MNFIDLYNSPEFLKKCSAPQEEVRHFLTIENAFFTYERGDISDEDFYLAVKSNLGYSRTFREFERDLAEDMKFELARDVFDFFLDFKGRNISCVDHWLLSNLNKIHRRHLYRLCPGLFPNFSERFLSCDMGCRKPEEEIYVQALEVGGAKAEDCLFIDDKKENTDAAEELGIRSHCFGGVPGLKKFLRGFGFEIDEY